MGGGGGLCLCMVVGFYFVFFYIDFLNIFIYYFNVWN